MHNAILSDVKKGLGIPEWDDGFDQELIIHINSALMIVSQLGLGPPGGIFIDGKEDTWSTVVDGLRDYEALKTLVILRVKQMFDPPSSSYVLESYNKIIAELEWRLNTQVEGAFEE